MEKKPAEAGLMCRRLCLLAYLDAGAAAGVGVADASAACFGAGVGKPGAVGVTAGAVTVAGALTATGAAIAAAGTSPP